MRLPDLRVPLMTFLFVLFVIMIAWQNCGGAEPDTVWTDTTYVYMDSRAFIYPCHRSSPPCDDLILHHARTTTYVRFAPPEVTGDDMEMVNIIQYTGYIDQVWVGDEVLFIVLDGKYNMTYNYPDSTYTLTSVYDFDSDGHITISDYVAFIASGRADYEIDEFLLIYGKPSVYEWRATE